MIFINGKFFCKVIADLDRSDLSVLGSGYTNYGFSVATPRGVRPDDIIFGRSGDGYIVQGPNAKQSHLVRLVYQPSLIGNLPEKIEFSYSGSSKSNDSDIGRRICISLSRAYEDGNDDYGALWGSLIERGHGDFLRFALEGQHEEVADYLSELGRRDLSTGFLGGPGQHKGVLENPAYRSATATLFIDRVLSLGEALGCRTVENPEQGARFDPAALDLEKLVSDIAAHVGLENLQPPIGGYWGVRTRHGLMHMRLLDALYTSVRLNAVRQQLGLSGVVEIGGGAGFLAHFALALGVTPYKIIDIPSVGAAQAYTLRDQPGLKLYGEDVASPRVELAPPWAMATNEHAGYNLLVNVDSLPEIETSAAIAYLVDARAKGFRYLLSINQESGNLVGSWSQGQVRQIAERAGGYTMISRHRDWMRKGYVEELYRIDPP